MFGGDVDMRGIDLAPPEISYAAILGRVILLRRRELGIYQAALADALGINQSAYCRVEAGDTVMNVFQLRQAAEVLQMGEDELLQRVASAVKRVKARHIPIVNRSKRDARTRALLETILRE